jgi:hypothetical protein
MVKTRTDSGRDDGPFSGMSKSAISRHTLSPDDKKWLGEQIRAKARTVQELHRWLGVPERSLRRFANNVKEDTAFKPRGRPALLDATALVDLQDFATLRRRGEKAKSEAAFAAKVRVLADQTRIRDGNHRPTCPPSARYIKGVKNGLKVRTTACSQQTTVPRQRADEDIRSQFVHAAALEVLMRDVDPRQLFNLDGVSYTPKTVNGKVVYIKDSSFEGPIEREGDKPATLAQGLKVINVVSASGHLCHQIIIYADKDIDPKDFTPLRCLKGFGPGSSVNERTYFTASNTRNGVAEQYTAIFNKVIIPWIKEMRAAAGLGEHGTRAAPALLIMDGEKTPIDGLLLVPGLEDMDLKVLKGPPSWSARSNPLDAGKIHSSTKGGLAKLELDHALFANAENQQLLDEMFKEMLPGHSKDKRDEMVDGTIRVMGSYRNLALSKMIQESFVKSGLIGDGVTDILATQLGLGTARVSEESMQQMRSAWLPCVEHFRNEGQLTEKMLDDAGVPKPVFPAHLVDSRQTPHDERPIENQRSVDLTHSKSAARATGRYQVKLCRNQQKEENKKMLLEKKEWNQQLKDPNSEFNLAVREELLEIQERTMDEAFERDAQFALQSEWLVQQRQTEELADWEAPKSTAPRPVKPKRPAVGKENRENFRTDPYAKLFNENKSRGISKPRSR